MAGSGSAMGRRAGPAPDPNSLRSEKRAGDWLVLPREVTEPAPDFPLLDASERELHIWATLWAKPQSFAWRQLDMADQVALYTRRWCEVETPGASVAASTLIVRMADGLGLSVIGLNSLRWKFAPMAPAEVAAAPKPVTDIRSRLKR